MKMVFWYFGIVFGVIGIMFLIGLFCYWCLPFIGMFHKFCYFYSPVLTIFTDVVIAIVTIFFFFLFMIWLDKYENNI